MAAARNDVELAEQIGTNPKSLNRWRKRYAGDAPTTRDPAQWRKFMEDNLLGPFSAQRQYGATSLPQIAPRASKPFHEWDARRGFLFDILEEVHNAYNDGQIDFAEYHRIGTATVPLIVELGTIWNVEIDASGYVNTWLSILAKCCIEKERIG